MRKRRERFNLLSANIVGRLSIPLLIAFSPWANAEPKPKITEVIRDVELCNQDGELLKLGADLIGDQVVAMSFVFTSCETICKPIGASFGQLQGLVGDRLGKDISLITVSIDPATDTPQRLKAWGNDFGAKPGWSLLTSKRGEGATVSGLLKKLKVFAPDIESHSPFVLLINGKTGELKRVNGLKTPIPEIAGILKAMADSNGAKTKPGDKPHPYFSDAILVNQNGEEMRLYTDLIKGKIVVVNAFFATCKGVCPKTMETFKKLQASLGDRLGKDVHLISITVDSKTDTWQKLGEYAKSNQVGPGWYLLSGDTENVDEALTKLGFYTDVKESHSNIFIMGNEPTGLWKKAQGLADAKSVGEVLKSVLDDQQ